MEKGKVIAIDGKKAKVLFENVGIQKTVSIARHVSDLKKGDEVAVIFECEKIGGLIVGVY